MTGCHFTPPPHVFFLSSSFSWLHNELQVAMVGHKVDLSYSYNHLGETTQVLQEIAAGTHPFCKVAFHMGVSEFIWSFKSVRILN